jgi:hypothetical protein
MQQEERGRGNMSAHFLSGNEHDSSSPARAAQGKRGLTIVELLIACGLFVTVTLAFFQIFSPALRRFGKYDAKQENMQNFITFKEHLTRRLGNAVLLKDRVTAESLEFYSPYQVDAPCGRVNMIDTAEMIYWNENFHCRIYAQHNGNETVIKELGDKGERKLWNLGKDGTVGFTFQSAANPILETKISIPQGDNPSLPPWEKKFSVYIRDFK